MGIVRYVSFLMLAALLMLAAPVRAADDSDDDPMRLDDMTVVDTSTVKEILKSDMIMLDDATRYRLDNILVPLRNTPVIDELKREFLNKEVTVYTYHDSAGSLDRYDIPLVHVVTEKGEWIQQELISKGLVWAYTSTQPVAQSNTQTGTQSSQETSQQIMDTLKQVEEKARRQHKGFWADQAYAVKTPNTVKGFENSYQIVEGRILSVYIKPGSGTVFFNFGDNWKKDFSVRIISKNISLLGLVEDLEPQSRSMRTLVDENNDPLLWKDRIVRVRGWVVRGSGGPIIDLTNQEQIDIIPQARR